MYNLTKENNKKLNNLLKLIKKNNSYIYRRIKKQMDIYTDSQGNFSPDKSFYEFMKTLIKENYKEFKDLFEEHNKKILKDNYYYWFFLYSYNEPKILKEKNILEKNGDIILENIINKNQEKTIKETEKVVKNLVKLGKNAYFIQKIIKNQIEKDLNRKQRIIDTENTRIIAEATEEARKELNLVKVWVSTIDKKTRDTHQLLDGQRTKDVFISSSGATGEGPGMFDDISENIRCRCRIILQTEDRRDERIRRVRLIGGNVELNYKNYEEYKKVYDLGDF